MNAEIKQKWVAALRSGEYKQGKSNLRTATDEFCCLGVLCDLAEKEGVIKGELDHFIGAYRYGTRTGYLPLEVCKWAGTTDNPDVGGTTYTGTLRTLTYLNDVGTSFKEIARLIEESL